MNKLNEEYYQQQCYNKAMEYLQQMTWQTQTGEVMFGHLLFKIEELENEVKRLQDGVHEARMMALL